MENDIALRRLRKVLVRQGAARHGDEVVGTICVEAAQLGFVLSEEVVDALRTVENERLARLAKELLGLLAKRVGAHRDYRPLYPGFPDEVVSIDLARLYFNAFEHYRSAGVWRPLPDAVPQRSPLGAGQEPAVVRLATRFELDQIFASLASAKTSLSATDVADLRWFVLQQRDDIARLLPSSFPHRENMAIVASLLWRHAPITGAAFVSRHLSTGTDVLRWWVALSDGDVSLSKPTRLVSLPRAARRLIVDKLETAPHLAEDMAHHREAWKRLGERLHPGELTRRRPKTADAFAVVRGDAPGPVAFAGRVERALAAGSTDIALAALLDRPGEMARRLDVLLRRHSDAAAVLAGFSGVAYAVSTPVLLQVRAHFLGTAHPRGEGRRSLRVFIPKGQTARLSAREEDRVPLSPALGAAVVDAVDSALLTRFGRLYPLGRTFVDPGLVEFNVPLAQRSASRVMRSVARGSRFALPDDRVVRLFLWWRNGGRRTDIDLSASFFDTDYKYVDILSYYSLKTWGGVHSGDIVDAPNGAAEFIDLDTVALSERGVRFVVASLTSYTHQPYSELPECFAGWMRRDATGSGEIFEPRSVVDRVDLTSETTFAIPVILDLAQRRAIWSDLALRSDPRFVNAVGANLRGVSMLLEAITTLRRPTLHELFTLHAQARGEIVDDPERAETVFSLTEGITPFDSDVIRSQFL